MQGKAALIVAAIAVVLSCTGSAIAAKLITGKQIKNGSITGTDISDGTIGTRDLASGPAMDVAAVDGPEVTLQPGQSSYQLEQAGGPKMVAACPAGQVVSGVGFNNSVASVGFAESFGTFAAAYFYNDTSIPVPVSVQALCVRGSDVAARALASSSTGRFERMQRAAERTRSN